MSWFVNREAGVSTQQSDSTISRLSGNECSAKTHIKSIIFASKIVSELRVTTSYAHQATSQLPLLRFTWANWPTFIGVMMVSTFFVLSSRTPFKMLISSSRSGSSPVRWNCRKDLSSAFLYV